MKTLTQEQMENSSGGAWTSAAQCLGGAVGFVGSIFVTVGTGGLAAALTIGAWTMGGLNMGVGCGKWFNELRVR